MSPASHLCCVAAMSVHHSVLGCILLGVTVVNKVSSIFTVGVHHYTFRRRNLFSLVRMYKNTAVTVGKNTLKCVSPNLVLTVLNVLCVISKEARCSKKTLVLQCNRLFGVNAFQTPFPTIQVGIVLSSVHYVDRNYSAGRCFVVSTFIS